MFERQVWRRNVLGLNQWAVVGAIALAGAVNLVLAAPVVLHQENFNTANLGTPVDEGQTGNLGAVWSPDGPAGWAVDRSNVPGDPGNNDLNGVNEFRGWTFVDKDFWNEAADQRRSVFDKASGNVAVADPDEFDDRPHPGFGGNPWDNGPGNPMGFNSFMQTGQIDMTAAPANEGFIRFDSSWRQEIDTPREFLGQNQTASLQVSYDNGATFSDVFRWESDPQDLSNPPTFVNPNFKQDGVNETIMAPINNPANATAQFRFGMETAGNDWWWAVDNIEVGFQAQAPKSNFFFEDFESVALGNNVDEASGQTLPNVWTDNPPAGWTVDDSGVPGAGGGNDGVTEWAGWSFAKGGFWRDVAGDQKRSAFVGDPNNVKAIADPDEWDDLSHDPGTYNAFMSTPSIDITGFNPSEMLLLSFDSSWREEDFQTAIIEMSLDGGATFTQEVLRWESGAVNGGSPAFFKDDATNERVTLQVDPMGATDVAFRFGMIDAGNDWWWAVDNISLDSMANVGPETIVYAEDFDSLPLQDAEDEGNPQWANQNVWTDQPVNGWTPDDSGVPGVGDLDDDGVTEWAGWAFVRPDFWVDVAEDQNRSQFLLGDGVVAVADPDEWDDLGHDSGTYDAWLESPLISLVGIEAGSVMLEFDSSWRPEDDQKAAIEVDWGMGAGWERILFWTSDSIDANFKPDATNEQLALALSNPAGASGMMLRFGVIEAGNDWWWAIDNVRITGEQDSVSPIIPEPTTATLGLLAAVGVAAMRRRR